jgi:hypothetical protein
MNKIEPTCVVLVSLAFVHKEEKIEQEKGKGKSEKGISPKDFFFLDCHFLGLASPHNVFHNNWNNLK